MRVDLGPPKNRLLDATEYNAGRAVKGLKQQIQDIAGRDFFGCSVIKLLWEAGQLTEVRTKVKRAER